jgi:Predicted flavin-nucleotide-binding protein
MTQGEMEHFLKKHSYGRLGLCVEDEPYVVPVAYGYDNGGIYFHSASQGKKLEFMKKNNRVCFEVDEWQKGWASVICYGKVTLREDAEAKKKCFELLTGQELDEEHLQKVGACIGVIQIEEMTGRCNADFIL